MSLADFFKRMNRDDRNAEIIFDKQEPIGRATDLVMPRRRWFRHTKQSELFPPAKGESMSGSESVM